MKALVQRVINASVTVNGKKISSIGKGLLIFIGVITGDTDDDLDYLAAKCANLRIFDDEKGIPNRSVMDIGGEILAVSQFTLAASTKKGNRPSYIAAASPEEAEMIYQSFCKRIAEISGLDVRQGKFRADMQVELINDGPMTIMIDSAVNRR